MAPPCAHSFRPRHRFTRLVFVRASVRIGILWESKDIAGRQRARFVGLSSDGTLVGVSAKQAKQFSEVPKCARDNIVRVQVDMDSFTISFAVQHDDTPTPSSRKTASHSRNKASARDASPKVIGPFDLISPNQRAQVSLQQRIRAVDEQLTESYGSGLDQACAKLDKAGSGVIALEQWRDLLARSGCGTDPDVLQAVFAPYLNSAGKFKFRNALQALHNSAKASTSFVARPCVELLDRGDCVELVEMRGDTVVKSSAGTPTVDADALAIGAQVNVRYGGGFTHYPGEVICRNDKQDGSHTTYDVRFADSQVYRDVKRTNLELVKERDDLAAARGEARRAHGSLELRIYVALLRRIDDDSTPASAIAETRRGKAHAKAYQRGGGVADDAPPEAISFCDAGELVPQDLYRRHFEGFRIVPLSDMSCVVEPGLGPGPSAELDSATFRQPPSIGTSATQPLAHGMDTRLGLGGWRLIGTRDLSNQSRTGTQGEGPQREQAEAFAERGADANVVGTAGAATFANQAVDRCTTMPITIRFDPHVDTQPGKTSTFRVCVMGVIGRRKVNGEFSTVKTLVDSSFVRDLPPNYRERTEGAAGATGAASSMSRNSVTASRFYVLSPPFLARERPMRAKEEFASKPAKQSEVDPRVGPKRSRVKARRDMVLQQRRYAERGGAARRRPQRASSPKHKEPIRRPRRPVSHTHHVKEAAASPSRAHRPLSPQSEARPPFFARVDTHTAAPERPTRGRSRERGERGWSPGSPVRDNLDDRRQRARSPEQVQRRRGRSPETAAMGVQALGLRPTAEIRTSLRRLDEAELEFAKLKHEVEAGLGD
jgi:hypothetical protein